MENGKHKKIEDLRSFLEILEENGEVTAIEKEVSLKHELGSVLATLEKGKQGEPGFLKRFRTVNSECAEASWAQWTG